MQRDVTTDLSNRFLEGDMFSIGKKKDKKEKKDKAEKTEKDDKKSKRESRKPETTAKEVPGVFGTNLEVTILLSPHLNF